MDDLHRAPLDLLSELERAVPGMSQRMLSTALETLERAGMVIREVFPEVPPRVECDMTGLGNSLLRPMQGAGGPGQGELRAAQSRYDDDRL